MRIIHDLQELTAVPRHTVATIGNFDGVHLGHRAIFRRVVAEARQAQGTATVITFNPHPLKLLAPERAPLLIDTYAERERLIAASCIDLLVCLPFTATLAALPATTFVTEILLGSLGLKHLIVGYDYAFGRDRQGDAIFLQDCGERYGFTVEVLPPIKQNQDVYSSTRIRQLLLEGDVESAASLLGRHFTLEGEVIHGAGRGRKLGFPTANLHTGKELLPKAGVYAVKVQHGAALLDGVANIGKNPTFGENELTVEVHLLDGQPNLYGETLRFYFVQRLREEMRFAGVPELCAAIQCDIIRARQILCHAQVIEYQEDSEQGEN
ncbi:MAG: riboflavin biosynthesis protein RibF [Deltaproteobacteria bacterium HGW-Deltaproteobacteria-4]|nr:MAG: riboflavin biosynthesis protein RibF [Deltaproteobacteria bacterium HGW-Deltaproteobacteria-4]